MMFLFDVVETGSKPEDRFRYDGFTLKDFKQAVINMSSFTEGTDAWSTVFTENHDQPRSITRFGNDSPKHRFKSGKMLATLQAALTGTLFIYQGQEIGMTNVPRSWPIEEYLDINSINYYNQFKAAHPDDKEALEKLLDTINLLARDNARTPVQWDDSDNAGFSTGKPWMRVNDNYKEINVASQVNDKTSLFHYWKKALEVRKEYKNLLIYGKLNVLDFDNEKTFTFTKTQNKDIAYIVLNFTEEDVKFEKLVKGDYSLVLSNVDNADSDILSPYEARVYIVDETS